MQQGYNIHGIEVTESEFAAAFKAFIFGGCVSFTATNPESIVISPAVQKLIESGLLLEARTSTFGIGWGNGYIGTPFHHSKSFDLTCEIKNFFHNLLQQNASQIVSEAMIDQALVILLTRGTGDFRISGDSLKKFNLSSHDELWRWYCTLYVLNERGYCYFTTFDKWRVNGRVVGLKDNTLKRAIEIFANQNNIDLSAITDQDRIFMQKGMTHYYDQIDLYDIPYNIDDANDFHSAIRLIYLHDASFDTELKTPTICLELQKAKAIMK
jgi:hypothetical protein